MIVLGRESVALWEQRHRVPMASVSKVSILDYFNIVFEGENGKIESNCKACGTRIQAKRSVTSNFVTHLKVFLILLIDSCVPTASACTGTASVSAANQSHDCVLCPSEEAPGHVR